jgi:tRNA pseudouridine55 synthase
MDGILVIDKPAGLTSHDVVARVRRSLRERRIGHTGTLDPFATGVLVLLVGRATRLAQFLAGAEKEYEATIRFGYATDTGDLTGTPRLAEGEVIKPCAVWTDGEIEAACAPLRGEIEQVPPMYSAKKMQGRKLYELARRGVEVERPAVRVVVHALEALPTSGPLLTRQADGTCDLRVRVVCSAGTYVRTLAESIGANLQTGAHLTALRRTRAGAFQLRAAVGLEQLNEMVEHGRAGAALLPLNAALPELLSLHLTAEDARRVRHGAAVGGGEQQWPDGAQVKLYDAAGALLAVAVYDAARGQLRPRVMLATENNV